jgi:hypothetical protein
MSEREAAVGTITMGQTQSKGLTWGRARAKDGIPGSTESQVEQTLDSGWELRPEATRVAEAVWERVAQEAGGMAEWTLGGTIATRAAGQLVKVTQWVKTAKGSGGETSAVVEADIGPGEGGQGAEVGSGVGHLVAWAGNWDLS